MTENALERRIRIKEKIIAGLKKGTKIELIFTNGVRIKGTVEEVELCSNLEHKSWHKVYLNVAGKIYEYDSRMDAEVMKCEMPENEGVLMCKNMFEIYNIPFGLSDDEFMQAVFENWDKYEDYQKEEITDIMACSINGDILRDIFDKYVLMQKNYKENSEKMIKIVEKKEEETKVGTIGNAIKNMLLIACAASVASASLTKKDN